ncbi:MAG: hypothetical protein KL787_08600 [Taibaiella sp.]|nr:hypothetical protein [Taibaiella sp.]
MVKIILLALGILGRAYLFAQDKDIITSEIRTLVEEADSCYNQGGNDCDIIYKRALSLITNTQKDKPSAIYNKLGYYYFNKKPDRLCQKIYRLKYITIRKP